MKPNDEQVLHDEQVTEIEYTPIRRKSRESGGVCVREDEISLAMPEEDVPSLSVEEPEQTVTPSEEMPSPFGDDETIQDEDLPMDVMVEKVDALKEETNPDTPDEVSSVLEEVASDVTEEGEQDFNDAECGGAASAETPIYERVILPDEISLADVLPLMNEETEGENVSEEALEEEIAEPVVFEEATLEEEEEFVFTPMPELVEYERVVLPDEISLVDVLDEIRPTGVSAVLQGEEATSEAALSEDAQIPEVEAEEETASEPTAEFVLPDDIFLAEPTEDVATVEISDEEPSEDTELPEEVSVQMEDREMETPSEEEIAPEDEVAEETVSSLEDAVDETLPDAYESVFTEETISESETIQDVPIASDETPKKKDEPKERPIENRFDLIELFAFTLAFVLLLTTFFFRSSAVIGSSMERTLHDGDQLILYSFMYEPKVGDIIVFEDYSTGYREPLVKRVIATEGQKVEIYDAYTVFVDGVKLEEGYIFLDGPDLTNYPIIHTVAEGHIFVMGDHRNGSSDSRKFRDVSVETVLGKVIVRYYPFDTFTKFD